MLFIVVITHLLLHQEVRFPNLVGTVQTLLPPIAVYCEKCGNLQPEEQSFSEPQPANAVTESESLPSSGSGLPDSSSSSPI